MASPCHGAANGWRAAIFYNHLVATNAPLGGISSHWTRPLDIVAGVFCEADAHFDHGHETATGGDMVSGMSCPCGRCADGTRGAEIVPSQPRPCLHLLLMVASPYMADYFKPGDADHHGLMSVLWCGVILIALDERNHLPARFSGRGVGGYYYMDEPRGAAAAGGPPCRSGCAGNWVQKKVTRE